MQLALIDFGKAKDLRFSSYPEYSTNTVSTTQFNKCEQRNKGMTSDHSEYPERSSQHSNTKGNVSLAAARVDSQQRLEEKGEDTMVMFVGNVAGDPSSSQHLPYYHCGRTLMLLLLLMLF